jgi:excisionase family DNA binding protein
MKTCPAQPDDLNPAANGHAALAAPDQQADATATKPPPGERARPPVEVLLWDLEQAAQALNVSTKTLKRMVAGGEIPGVVRLARRRLFSRRALEQWIDQGCPPVRRGRR